MKMHPRALGALLLAAASTAGLAQAPAAGAASAPPAPAVRESTDPARAAKVERAATELKKRPTQPSAGLVRGKTGDGYELLSGGVTVGERTTMQAERGKYSVWIATVAKPSGAYLADVQLKVSNTKSKAVVLERKMEGPWLFVALPEGAYELSATFKDSGAEKAQTLSQRISVPAKGQRQAVLRFDSKAAIDPEQQSAGNPFGAAPAKK